MKPRERVFAALQHQVPDQVPRFEIWIDALLDELGQDDAANAYVNLGQDCVMMPSNNPPQSNAWRNGVDEWGRIWRQFVLPYHRRIVAALDAPLIWHSDGDVEALLPMAVEAGFVGFHGLDPVARMDLSRVKREFGRDLVLIGNVDIRVLFGFDLQAVRSEVDRCFDQGAPEGGYMIASCNSICEGMNPAAVAEMFHYEAVVSRSAFT